GRALRRTAGVAATSRVLVLRPVGAEQHPHVGDGGDRPRREHGAAHAALVGQAGREVQGIGQVLHHGDAVLTEQLDGHLPEPRRSDRAGRGAAGDHDVVQQRFELLEHRLGVLLLQHGTTPTRRWKVNDSRTASAMAATPAGLWAASTSTVGLRRTTSRRPGEVTSAKAALTTSWSSGCSPPPTNASTAAIARAALCAWNPPKTGRNTSV